MAPTIFIFEALKFKMNCWKNGKNTMRKIKTGNIEIDPDEFNPKKGKFRVNMFVDLDVIDAIRERANAEHMPYQTWINRKLRELIEGKIGASQLTEEEIAKLIDERIEKRVDKKVLKRA